MEKQGLEAVLVRNQFYWENYQRLVMAVTLFILLIIGQLGFILYVHYTPPKPKYFATHPDGVPIDIIPLNVPLQTDEYVLAWAKDAVVKMYAFDFLTYRRVLQNDDIYFTWKGHVDFMLGYKASNNLVAVKQKKQVVSVEVTGPGKVNFAGQRQPHLPYSWELTIPATFTYQNSKNDIIKQVGTFVITVDRDSTLRHPDGIAISQIVFET